MFAFLLNFVFPLIWCLYTIKYKPFSGQQKLFLYLTRHTIQLCCNAKSTSRICDTKGLSSLLCSVTILILLDLSVYIYCVLTVLTIAWFKVTSLNQGFHVKFNAKNGYLHAQYIYVTNRATIKTLYCKSLFQGWYKT